jgi:hypothetical protein
VTVPILEEALGVKAVALKPVAEGIDDVRSNLALIGVGIAATVESLGAHVSKDDINVFLQVLLGEDLIDGVTEVLPPHVTALFGRPKVLHQLLEFCRREHDLGHVEADAELTVCDEARAELVKVSEEFSNSSAALLAEETDASENILHIVRAELNDVSLNLAGLSAWVVVERLVVSSADPENSLMRVYLIAEVNVVDLIGITLIHVPL